MNTCTPDSFIEDDRKRSRDEEHFNAWCEWRKWCSVLRVLEPYSADEKREKQWRDDLESNVRQKYYGYLMDTISYRVFHMVKGWINISIFDKADVPDKEDFERGEPFENANAGNMHEKDERNMSLYSSMCDDNSDDEKDANHVISDSRMPFIIFFDEWMKKMMKKVAEDGTRKSYKDYVFYKIKIKENEQESPMKIIHGKILKTNSQGESRGYLVDIVKDYLEEEYSSMVKEKKVFLLESLSTPIENTDDGDVFTLEDKISSPRIVGGPSFESAEIYRRLFPPVKNDAPKMQYQRAEKIILFATAYGVRIANPALNSILGGKKEFASNRRNALFKRIQGMIEDDESELNLLLGLSQLVLDEFQENNKNGTEKEAFEYLCMLRDRDSNRNDGPTQVSAEPKKGFER